MKILVIAATGHEITFTRSLNVDSAITGVGTAATIYNLQKKLQQTSYDFVIQIGIAGSFNKEFALGNTVLVQRDCFGDLGVEEKGQFSSIFDMGLEEKDNPPYSNGWLKNNNELLKKSPLELVRAVTVNKICYNPLQTTQLMEAFDPEIESMEGAAFHYVCLQENIPFVQIRSISNYVGERDKSKWEMQEAIKNLNAETELFIKSLNILTV